MKVPTEIPSLDAIEKENHRKRELENAILEVRQVIKLSYERRSELIGRLSDKLSKKQWSRTNVHLALKLKMHLAVLRGDFKLAFHESIDLVDQIRSWEGKYPIIVVAIEMRKLAMHAVYLRDRDFAVRVAMELGKLNSDYYVETREINRSSVMVGVTVAETFGIEDMAATQLERIQYSPNHFDPEMRRKLFFFLALASFYNANYKQVQRCLHLIHEIGSKGSKVLAWEPALLSALSHFEVRNIDLAERRLRSASRVARGVSTAYPQFASATIRALFNASELSRRPILQQRITDLQALLSNASEKDAAKYFNIRSYLMGKFHGKLPKHFLGTDHPADKFNQETGSDC